MKLVLVVLSLLLTQEALAESWCAQPLWVHEWGVHVIDDDHGAAPGLPDFFHRDGPAPLPVDAVRNLPLDHGVRKLPVLHFYSPLGWGRTVPLGVEVGFTKGPPAAWYPQIDTLARAAKRQLVWSRIDLTPTPQRPPATTSVPWVTAVRGFERALWANGASESERFVFYEGATREGTPLKLSRGAGWTPTKRVYVLTNSGPNPVHDLTVVHRDGAVFVVHAPSIPANKSFTFVLEDHRVAPNDVRAATRGWVADTLIDRDNSAAPADYRWSMSACVMMRDPAVAFEKAEGHRLYREEADALLDAWSARFFDQQGTTILYREDLATLDAAMPLALYTDMYNYVVLRRAGLALWEKVALP